MINIFLPWRSDLNVPSELLETEPAFKDLADQTIIPIHTVLVQLPETTILIDAGSYAAVAGRVPRIHTRSNDKCFNASTTPDNSNS